tara:strand:+ start:158 stop:385 length:228 start_codon:yes stop_codon:yes gene_type:complete
MVFALLFGGQSERLLAVLNHLPHLADAFSTLGGALVVCEDFARTRRSGLNGEGDITLAQAVAVADIHGEGIRIGR